MTTVGFVGLGNMGGPMAANLAKAGFTVKVFDLVPALIAGVEGASGAGSARDAATGVDVFVSMLPAGRHVESLYIGADGVADVLGKETLVIDCSTIDPGTARKVAGALADRGITMLDAPVSGGTAGAQNGTLTFIVGGSQAGLDRGRPLFEAMGANIYHAGDSGSGQIAKVCNNMLLAICMAGTAEALALGVRNGLDPAKLSEIMQKSSGGNWCLNVYNPWPGVQDGVASSRGYSGGFLTDLMTKDLGLALETAVSSASSIPMGSLARNLFQTHALANGAGRLDFSSIQWLYAPDLKG
ncbi:MAG: 3-hydroxyisobutyrate dehydrogenase [Pseudomonadales bacterium]|nr:3-hydroxyisobutyrate dehydrogenase [Pseudomonadales bacterium]MCP5182793.1 3-hydroxyisobutyrate dehydrogenase [Pseudomonadales bacterium]